jgi:hypothetical protein
MEQEDYEMQEELEVGKNSSHGKLLDVALQRLD